MDIELICGGKWIGDIPDNMSYGIAKDTILMLGTTKYRIIEVQINHEEIAKSKVFNAESVTLYVEEISPS